MFYCLKTSNLMLRFLIFASFAEFFSYLPNKAKISLFLQNFQIFDLIWYEIRQKHFFFVIFLKILIFVKNQIFINQSNKKNLHTDS